MKRAIAVAVIAVLSGVVGLASPASAGDPAGTTTITFRVDGCDGCVLSATTILDPRGTPYVGPKEKVRRGVAVMTVPTAQTLGMTFWVDAPWRVEIDAQPLLAFQYRGVAPGSTISRADVLAATKASPCWAGTRSAAVELKIVVRTTRVDAFDPESPDPGTTRAPLAWVEPMQKALPPFQPLYDGVLAAQDYILCTNP